MRAPILTPIPGIDVKTLERGWSSRSSSNSRSAILGAFGRSSVTSRRPPALRIWAGEPSRSSSVRTAGCCDRGPRTRSSEGWIWVSRPCSRFATREASPARSSSKPTIISSSAIVSSSPSIARNVWGMARAASLMAYDEGTTPVPSAEGTRQELAAELARSSSTRRGPAVPRLPGGFQRAPQSEFLRSLAECGQSDVEDSDDANEQRDSADDEKRRCSKCRPSQSCRGRFDVRHACATGAGSRHSPA